jgi:lactate dehydrogenase-like 2-hydroxyacid dehydrogenase
MFDKKMLSLMKKGSYIVNTARGKIMDRDALVQAVKSNHIEGYAGDVWYPQVRKSFERNFNVFGLVFSQLQKIIHGVQCHDMQ